MPKNNDKERFAKVFKILEANKEIDFVKRIFDAENAPAIVNKDGSLSTHRMATAEADGVHYVFPTIMRDDFGELQQLEIVDAFKVAINRGEAIGFETAKEADWFERNWKVVWGHPARK